MDVDRGVRAPLQPGAARLAGITVGVAVVVATARLFLEYRACGLLGWDTYPLIDVSRMASPSDVLDLFRESLLGREEAGLYYRPLPKLTLALDYALWGLEAPGYHLTSALCIGAAIWAIYAASAQLLAPPFSAGALVAVASFGLHPLLVTAMPVPSRRGDVLCLLFTALALAAQARTARSGRAWPLGPAALAALAIASKETGFLLLGLCPLVACLVPRGGDRRQRLRAAARSSATILVVAAAWLGVRWAVLGGAVGDRPLRVSGLAQAWLAMLERIANLALSPGAVVGKPGAPGWTLGALGSAVGAAFLLAGQSARREAVAASLPAGLVSIAWFLALGALYAVGIILQPWYVLHAVAALALLAGSLAHAMGMLARAHRGAGVAAAAGLACLALLIIQQGRQSPLLRTSADWAEATRVSESYLADVRAAVEAGAPGEIVSVRRPPPLLPGRRATAAGVALLAPYSVEAWVRLAFPERAVRVVPPAEGVGVVRPDEIVVVFEAGRARAGQGR